MNNVQQQFANQHIAIVGLGKTGVSCVRFLNSLGLSFTVFDSREAPANLDEFVQAFPNINIHLGEFNETQFNHIDILVLSPGIDPRQKAIRNAVAQGAELLGDIELFARTVEQPVIAITGSNGKSTVTELVGDMAKQAGINVAVGGNLGVPALDLIGDDIELYVLELSSFQLETVRSLHAEAAVVLNISEDHMDRYDSIDEYAETKANIYRQAKTCLLNLDDSIVAAMVTDTTASTFSVEGNSEQYYLDAQQNEVYLMCSDQLLCCASELKLMGAHNYANVLAAIALSDAAGIDRQASVQAAKNFAGLPHRMQWVAERNKVVFINDSKATNVGATAAAVKSLQAPIVLIAGGIGKDQDFSPLSEALKDQAHHVVLMGRDADLIKASIAQCCEVSEATNMQQAVEQAADKAKQGDVVLLSPACASFDMYSGFEARGDDFCIQVKLLKEAV